MDLMKPTALMEVEYTRVSDHIALDRCVLVNRRCLPPERDGHALWHARARLSMLAAPRPAGGGNSLKQKILFAAERWPSGRRRTPAKGVRVKALRGFESLSLRHHPDDPGSAAEPPAPPQELPVPQAATLP